MVVSHTILGYCIFSFNNCNTLDIMLCELHISMAYIYIYFFFSAVLLHFTLGKCISSFLISIVCLFFLMAAYGLDRLFYRTLLVKTYRGEILSNGELVICIISYKRERKCNIYHCLLLSKCCLLKDEINACWFLQCSVTVILWVMLACFTECGR